MKILSRMQLKLIDAGEPLAEYDDPAGEGCASLSCLVNRHILLDFGNTAAAALERNGVEPGAVEDFIIGSRAPRAYCCREAVALIRQAGDHRVPRVYALPDILAALEPHCRFEGHPIVDGSGFSCGAVEFTALSPEESAASRSASDPVDAVKLLPESFHFLIESVAGRVLYSGHSAPAPDLTARLPKGARFDAVILNAPLTAAAGFVAALHREELIDPATRLVICGAGDVCDCSPVEPHEHVWRLETGYELESAADGRILDFEKYYE